MKTQNLNSIFLIEVIIKMQGSKLSKMKNIIICSNFLKADNIYHFQFPWSTKLRVRSSLRFSGEGTQRIRSLRISSHIMVDKSQAPHWKLLLLTRMYCYKEAKTKVSSASLNKEVYKMRNDEANLNGERAMGMVLAQ